MKSASEPFFQRADDQSAHKAGITEPDLTLGWMHIHIHTRRRHIDEEHKRGMATMRNKIGIGGFDSAKDELVTDRATIHIGMNMRSRCTMIGWQSGKA